LTHAFGPEGNLVGVLVGAVLDELVIDVSDVGCKVGVTTVVVRFMVVELDVETAMQLQALLTRLATSPVQAAIAYVGMALVPAAVVVVKVAQND
jgi:hypothetical protein